MRLRIRSLMPLYLLCSCYLFAPKSFAFDYDKYKRDHKQLRSLTPATTADAQSTPSKRSKSKAMEKFAGILLEAMQSDTVPTKIFNTGSNISFYFKPAKITKVGITYKF